MTRDMNSPEVMKMKLIFLGVTLLVMFATSFAQTFKFPEGFRGHLWGQSQNELGPSVVEVYSDRKKTAFSIPDDKLKIGDAQLDSISCTVLLIMAYSQHLRTFREIGHGKWIGNAI